LMGCSRALIRLGLNLDQKLILKGAFTWASGVRAARELLDSGSPPPDALFCLNDAMAIGMLNELHRAGVSVPGDVALAGYDNVEAAGHLSLPSVACPMRLMGQLAAQWAINLSMRHERPEGHRLQVRLVVRNSSAGKQSPHLVPVAAVDAATGKLSLNRLASAATRPADQPSNGDQRGGAM